MAAGIHYHRIQTSAYSWTLGRFPCTLEIELSTHKVITMVWFQTKSTLIELEIHKPLTDAHGFSAII